jgi:hypothetical protein
MNRAQLLERIITSAAGACAARDAYHASRIRSEALGQSEPAEVARLSEREMGAVARVLAGLAAEGVGRSSFAAETAIAASSAELRDGVAEYERRIRAALAD